VKKRLLNPEDEAHKMVKETMRGRPKKEVPALGLKELITRGTLISPEELAPVLRVARVTIYSWARMQKIPHLKMEACIRFDPEEIKQWLADKRRVVAPDP
jgi:excisionase family DNA binding protein